MPHSDVLPFSFYRWPSCPPQLVLSWDGPLQEFWGDYFLFNCDKNFFQMFRLVTFVKFKSWESFGSYDVTVYEGVCGLIPCLILCWQGPHCCRHPAEEATIRILHQVVPAGFGSLPGKLTPTRFHSHQYSQQLAHVFIYWYTYIHEKVVQYVTHIVSWGDNAQFHGWWW